MPTYTYQARDESGRLVKGALEAESQVALAERLKKMGYLVTRMDETAHRAQLPPFLQWGRSVSQEDLLLGLTQLSNLVGAGVPLITSIGTVATQASPLSFRQALEKVGRRIESGATFSQALSNHPDLFPKQLVALAAVGEASGQLETVLARYAAFLEKDLALRRQLRGALLYPSLLLVASLLLVLFVVSFVVPQFATVFLKAGISLPGPTLLLLGVGNFLRARWWMVLFLAVLAGAGCQIASNVPAIRLQVDQLLLRLPVIGRLIHQATVARFSRTLATLVASGIPILAALETARGIIENQVFSREIQRVAASVERGERIAGTLLVGGVFLPDAIQMIRVGEESGRLDLMLERVADFYELRVNFLVGQLTTLLEPILLVMLGGIIALIMASLLLPMFDMVKVLQRGGMQ